jgi:mannose-1-phosphate guanylyltransferase/mannose-6-phosphate isomerase
MKQRKTMYAVIMAGGSGTRFWPLSREKMPKQLLKIGGEESLIQQTIGRILPLIPFENLYIVTNWELSESIGQQLSAKYGRRLWDANFILEPEAKDSAPALALAALHLECIDPESIMVVLAADHFIHRSDLFLDLIRKAGETARHDFLVTFGIKPNRPETGYGYIKAVERVGAQDHNGVYKVERFVEKPSVETAKKYIEDGNYFWNSGIFVWKTKTFLKEIEKHAPLLHAGMQEIKKGIGSSQEADLIKQVFKKIDAISVDYAIMEKAACAAVIPADIGWSDVGSWSVLDDVSKHDISGNVISGNVIDIGSKDTTVYAEKRLIATIGLKDTVVVDTQDATLVCNKEQAQDVKKVVAELKKRKSEEHVIHRTVEKPWGTYAVLEVGERYKIKRIEVKPGAKLSLQLHRHRSEHWVVVSGTARVTNGDKIYDIHPNESTYIPMSMKHRLENLGKIPLQIIEVQNGEYLEENDISRYNDDYQRQNDKAIRFLPSKKE